MEKALNVAKYFLSKDADGNIFSKDLMQGLGNRCFYEGNAKLNKFLHLAQNIYFAKTGNMLFEDDLIAYDNGAVVPEVTKCFRYLLANKECKIEDSAVKYFLDVFFEMFKNADVTELIELSHEDVAWMEKRDKYYTRDEVMDTGKYLNVYREQYADVIKIMDRMDLAGA